MYLKDLTILPVPSQCIMGYLRCVKLNLRLYSNVNEILNYNSRKPRIAEEKIKNRARKPINYFTLEMFNKLLNKLREQPILTYEWKFFQFQNCITLTVQIVFNHFSHIYILFFFNVTSLLILNLFKMCFIIIWTVFIQIHCVIF